MPKKQEKKWRIIFFFFRRFWVKKPRRSENVSDEKCSLRVASTRPFGRVAQLLPIPAKTLAFEIQLEDIPPPPPGCADILNFRVDQVTAKTGGLELDKLSVSTEVTKKVR